MIISTTLTRKCETIQLCRGCIDISIEGLREEVCGTVINTVESGVCFPTSGQKGIYDFKSYSFLAENGSFVWYVYSDTSCTPSNALVMGRACNKGSCCHNGGFYYSNTTLIFDSIRVGRPQSYGDSDVVLEPWEIALIVVGSIVLVLAIVGLIVFLVKRKRNKYDPAKLTITY